MGHYGIGPLVATAIVAELGDARGFSSSKQAVRCAGLDVTVHESDVRRRGGHLSRQGSPQVRWAGLRFAARHRRTFPLVLSGLAPQDLHLLGGARRPTRFRRPLGLRHSRRWRRFAGRAARLLGFGGRSEEATGYPTKNADDRSKDDGHTRSSYSAPDFRLTPYSTGCRTRAVQVPVPAAATLANSDGGASGACHLQPRERYHPARALENAG